MESLAQQMGAANAANQAIGRAAGLDLPFWSAGTAFLASSVWFAAVGIPVTGTVLVAASASLATLACARAREAGRMGLPLAVDRALQGVLAGALVWLAILLAGALFTGTGSLMLVPAALAIFLTLLVFETAMAVALLMVTRRNATGLDGSLAAAFLIDNRAFGCLGALQR